MEGIDETLEQMLKDKLYPSAEILGSFLVSVESPKPQHLALYGDALFGLGEFSRSLSFYKSAIDALRADSLHADDLFYKCALACARMRNSVASVQELVKIPESRRTFAMELLLAQQSVDSNAALAKQSFCRALRLNPFCLEAVAALIRLRAETLLDADLVATLEKAYPWFRGWRMALSSQANNNHGMTELVLPQLLQAHPRHPGLMAQFAICKLHNDSHQAARNWFCKARVVDPQYTHNMDLYGGMLRDDGKIDQLDRLGKELLDANMKTPEPWVIGAMFCEMKGERDKAVVFVDKALELDPMHHTAYLEKANIAVGQARHHAAAIMFRNAYLIQPTIDVFYGLIGVYESLGKSHEAVSLAKEAFRIHKKNPKAYALLAGVLSRYPEGRTKAQELLNRAFEINPTCRQTVLAQAQLHAVRDEPNKAIELLKKHLENSACHQYHIRLAELYCNAKSYTESFFHYNAALRLNPYCHAAKSGLEGLVKLSQGELAFEDDQDEVVSDNSEDVDNEGMI